MYNDYIERIKFLLLTDVTTGVINTKVLTNDGLKFIWEISDQSEKVGNCAD
jgi:hypothetical protein